MVESSAMLTALHYIISYVNLFSQRTKALNKTHKAPKSLWYEK